MTNHTYTFSNIKNIYCVGRNFGLHAKELGNDIPEQPLIFTKPTHAMKEAKGTVQFSKPLREIHHEVEIVLWVSKAYQPGLKVEEIVSAYTLGIDFTARDIQSELKKKGHPWEIAKGFPNSAILAPFRTLEDLNQLNHIRFGLRKNDEIVQQGSPDDMLFNFQNILDYIGQNLGLDAGDIIYTGTPAGVGPVEDQDKVELWIEDEVVGNFTIAIN